MVKTGQVNVGIGLEAAAKKVDFFFIPLFKERFDLTMLRESTQILAPILDHLQSSVFRTAMAGLSGYDTTHTGDQIEI